VPKILSRSGVSLADVYDVEGSIAGIEELQSREVQLVHEMATTIFSERVGAQILRISTGDIAQNITWDLLIPGLTSVPMRLLGVAVVADDGSRVTRVQASIRNAALITAGREIPFFLWHSGTDTSVPFRWVDNGAGVANESYLRQVSPLPALPGLLFGDDARRQVPAIVFRGNASGFGAGTVSVVLEVLVAWAESPENISSRGLPFPGW